MKHIILLSLLSLALAAPFIALYAISYARKGNFPQHIKIHKWLFWSCISAVLLLEVFIRVSGGSGSLISDSSYAGKPIFLNTLYIHIIGSTIFMIIWAYTIFWSSKTYKKRRFLPGPSTKTHKILGYISLVGLFYIAITALIVVIMAYM